MIRPLLLGIGLVGCIHPPEVVMVDRATALEEQAGGSFADIERKLSRTSIEAHPVPLTPKQFAELGIKPLPLNDTTEETDADHVDALLVQHCVGEGTEGLLVETFGQCIGATDRAEATELMERVNAARLQLWKWLKDQRKGASLDDIRRTWRVAHLKGVVCDGWVEASKGTWEGKKC